MTKDEYQQIREVLLWYEDEAVVANKFLNDKTKDYTLLAVLNVLAMDGGRRARDAITILERLQE